MECDKRNRSDLVGSRPGTRADGKGPKYYVMGRWAIRRAKNKYQNWKPGISGGEKRVEG